MARTFQRQRRHHPPSGFRSNPRRISGTAWPAVEIPAAFGSAAADGLAQGLRPGRAPEAADRSTGATHAAASASLRARPRENTSIARQIRRRVAGQGRVGPPILRRGGIRRFPKASPPPEPPPRPLFGNPQWTGHEVVLDVYPDVFAWGYLLVPKDLKPGERRPVVVCQHGLEGLPADTIADDPKSGGWGPYKAFAARLAERGFVVYAPHNPYR